MKTEKTSRSPKNDDKNTQKQDPLEKRRLQNRLSQRNHRRKIRDRIAKLQERVITNELRAAAALNGWDQQFIPSPLISPRHLPHHEFKCHMPKDSSFPSTDPISPFAPPFDFTAAASWPNDTASPFWPSTSQQPPGSVDQSTLLTGTIPSMPSIPSPMSQVQMQMPTGDVLDEDVFKDLLTTGPGFAETLPTTPNSPLCYTATEANLPHLIQVLSTMSPQAKLIILVPPDATCVSTTMYPSPPPTLPGNIGVDTVQPAQMQIPCGVCCCQARKTQSVSAQLARKECAPPGTFFP